MLLGINSRPRPPTFPAGTPSLIINHTRDVLHAAANTAAAGEGPTRAAAAIAAAEAAAAAAAAEEEAAAAAAAALAAATPGAVDQPGLGGGKGGSASTRTSTRASKKRTPTPPPPPPAAAEAAKINGEEQERDQQQPEQQQQQKAVVEEVFRPPPVFPHPYHTCPTHPSAFPLLQPLGALPPGGLLQPWHDALGSAVAPMQPYALAKALVDSGKMLALDQMLSTLKGEGHRVLLFCQVRFLIALI